MYTAQVGAPPAPWVDALCEGAGETGTEGSTELGPRVVRIEGGAMGRGHEPTRHREVVDRSGLGRVGAVEAVRAKVQIRRVSGQVAGQLQLPGAQGARKAATWEAEGGGAGGPVAVTEARKRA